MHSSKVTVKDIPDKASWAKLFEDHANGEAPAAAQEIVDRFALYLKYREVYGSHFLYQLRVSEATLLPLGWNASWYKSDPHILFEID